MRTTRIVDGGQPTVRTRDQVDCGLGNVLATQDLMGLTPVYNNGMQVTYTAWEYECLGCGEYDHAIESCPNLANDGVDGQ